MQAFTLFMIVVVTSFEFFSEGDKWGRWVILPGWAPYLAEITGAVAAVVVVLLGMRTRFQFVRAAYWIVFGILVFNIAAGIAINGVDSGPVFAGIRNYLRAIPWFLLPAVFAFNNEKLGAQLRLIGAIAVVQLPFSIQQTTTALGEGKVTGDWTAGTLVLSPTLTIFLISCLSVLVAYFVRNRISAWKFALLFVLLLAPVTINETKVTVFLLPIGVLTAALIAGRPENRLRYAAFGLGIVLLAGAIFVPIYNKMIEEREYAVSLSEFFTNPERVGRYLSTTDDIGVRTKSAGRIDSLTVPLRRLSREPAQLVFGLGIGNASDSALGRGFVGRHFGSYGPFTVTTFGRLVLEIGLLGTCCIFVLMWLVFRDSYVLARSRSDAAGAFAAGWAGVTAVITACVLYTDLVPLTALAFLFWYFSGFVAAERMRSLMPAQRT